MAQRQAIYTIKSDAVQGEGSYVKMRAILYGEAKRLRRDIEGMDDDAKMAANEALLISHVVAWDWVDDEGQPLPIPKDDPAVLDRLTAQELAFLGEAISGESAASKN